MVAKAPPVLLGERFVVPGADGTPRGCMRLMSDGTAFVELFDKKGAVAVIARVRDGHGTFVGVYDSSGRERLLVGADEEGRIGGFEYDDDGNERLLHSE